MSPREKQFIFVISLSASVVLIFTLLLYYIPAVLYVTLILGVGCVACYYHNGQQSLYARLGPVDPRRGLTVVAALRRWLAGRAANGVAACPAPPAGRSSRSHRGGNKAPVRDAGAYSSFGLPSETAGGLGGVYRRGVGLGGDSLFSPRDILMGSYISRPEGPAVVPPTVASGRGSHGPGAVVYPRDQLRERLSRPNHAIHTPNRRLSFSGEQIGSASRFTITPQRHYPLQQTGTSSVGLLPPAQWDNFRKKNILSPRNSSVLSSPCTVRIARPDHSTYRSPFLEHVGSPGGLCSPGPTPPADPCSRETVLKVLKESRKREVVDDEDRTFTDEQKSKRRRNDSGGSTHSAFEPLLPNGVQSQLVPKPGTLKRGLNLAAEEAVMKRSRTSSISSLSGSHIHTTGSVRNPIQSSYSSSQGFSQWKKALAHASPLSSPVSSRSQTPERASVKPREEDTQSPSSASSVKSDKVPTDTEPTISKVAPVPKVPVALSSSSSSSGGKRKRKIQLVASHGGEQISLPPPPELGYTITVKDLDQERRAALNKIQKVLEEVAPEPKKPEPPVAETTPSSQAAASSSVDSGPTLASLLAAPLPTTTTTTSSTPSSSVAAAAPIPVINLDPSPAATTTATSGSTGPSFTAAPARSSPAPAAAPAPGLPNSLLEILKMQSVPPASSTSTLNTTGSVLTTNSEANGSVPKPASTMAQPPPPYSTSALSGLTQPSSSVSSAFSQVLGGQTTKTTVEANSLFGTPTSSSATSTAPFTSAPTALSTDSAASSANPLLASGFKPIFGATTTAPASSASDNKPAVPTFKPLFGSVGGGFGQPAAAAEVAATSAPTATSASTASMFGGSLNSDAAAAAPPSMFGGLATSTSSSSASTTAESAVKPLFGNWGAPSTTSSASAPAPGASVTSGPFGVQFGANATAAPTAQTSSTSSAFAFGAAPATTASTAQPAPPASTAQNPFAFGQNTTTMSFSGFAMPNATTATTAPAAPQQQPTFSFGAATTTTAPPPAYPGAATMTTAAVKPFSFGGGNGAAAAAPASTAAPAQSPFTFGSAAGPTATTASTFGTPAKPAFGSGGGGFSFGTTSAPSASFGAAAQTQTAQAATFGFGNAATVQQTPAGPAANPAAGFNFGGAMTGTQFQTPVSNNPPPQMSVSGFNFGGAASGKPMFGTSTPTFGQSAPAGPIPFGSPATPVQGFNSVAPSPFGAATPSFSIGASSKPSGARQRLQARRQHPRKK